MPKGKGKQAAKGKAKEASSPEAVDFDKDPYFDQVQDEVKDLPERYEEDMGLLSIVGDSIEGVASQQADFLREGYEWKTNWMKQKKDRSHLKDVKEPEEFKQVKDAEKDGEDKVIGQSKEEIAREINKDRINKKRRKRTIGREKREIKERGEREEET